MVKEGELQEEPEGDDRWEMSGGAIAYSGGALLERLAGSGAVEIKRPEDAPQMAQQAPRLRSKIVATPAAAQPEPAAPVQAAPVQAAPVPAQLAGEPARRTSVSAAKPVAKKAVFNIQASGAVLARAWTQAAASYAARVTRWCAVFSPASLGRRALLAAPSATPL